MSYKFDSTTLILNKLDRREVVTIQSLMDDLRMSERTVHRYLRTLIDAGFPIIYDRSQERYMFSEGYSLRRPDLSSDEVIALTIAKKLLSNLGTGMEKGLSSLESKLAKTKAEPPKHIVLTAEKPTGESEKYLGLIHDAIANYKQIQMTYTALHSDETSRRKVKPYFLFFNEGFWYLRGYCHKAEEERTFALDRIASLKVLDESFLPKNFSPEEKLSEAFGTWLDGELIEVVLRFDKEFKPYVMRKKWHQTQSTQELPDGRLEMRFSTRGIGSVKKWVYQWIPFVEVVEPGELRDEMKKDRKKTLRRLK